MDISVSKAGAEQTAVGFNYLWQFCSEPVGGGAADKALRVGLSRGFRFEVRLGFSLGSG